MYGEDLDAPCPMCSMWADGWNALTSPLAENIDLVLVSSATPEQNDHLVSERGWGSLRFVSEAESSFKSDIGGKDSAGHQMPFISVYHRTAEGPRLAYSGGAHLRGDHWRGLDLLSPVWHLLDLTPDGRGDWMPSHRQSES